MDRTRNPFLFYVTNRFGAPSLVKRATARNDQSKSPEPVTNLRKRTMTIRSATSDDHDFILSLVPRFVAFELPKGRRKRDCLAAIGADIDRALREAHEGVQFFVVDDRNGARLGFLHLQIQRDFFSGERSCHVSDIAVAPGQDGRGIGRALLAHAETWALANHCKLLTLSVFPANARARGLYEQAGFTTDLVRMAKSLKDP